jgi:hypothetical protein
MWAMEELSQQLGVLKWKGGENYISSRPNIRRRTQQMTIKNERNENDEGNEWLCFSLKKKMTVVDWIHTLTDCFHLLSIVLVWCIFFSHRASLIAVRCVEGAHYEEEIKASSSSCRLQRR